MRARPAVFATEVKITSLDDADAALHELAWVQNRLAVIDAETKARIDAAKAAANAAAVVVIDDVETPLTERAALLSTVLAKWVERNIEKHLDPKKRSIELTHGKLGLRQQPLVAQIADDQNAASVLDAIDEQTGLVAAANAILERKSGIGGAKARDLIDIKVTVAAKAMKDGYEARRLTEEQLGLLGITLRAAYDEPVVTPTKIVVT